MERVKLELRYGAALALGLAMVGSIRLLEPHFAHVFFYLGVAAVAFASLRLGLGPSLLTGACILVGVDALLRPHVGAGLLDEAEEATRLALMGGLMGGLSVLGASYRKALDRAEHTATALQVSESRLRAAVAGSQHAFYMLEALRSPQGAIEDFRILEVNEEAAARVGKARPAMLGARLFELFPTARATPLYQRCFQALEDGQRFTLELPVPTGLMEPTWLHLSVVPFGDCLALTSRDISERKRAEEALRASEQRFRSLVETVPDPVFVHVGGDLAYANPVGLRLLGPARRLPQELLGGGQAGSGLPREVRVRGADGTELLLEVRADACRFDGKPAEVLVARDLTERKRYEAELALADRMSSLGTLAAGVGHEINNPLAYVTANLVTIARELQVFESRLPPPDARLLHDATAEALEGAERIRVIARGLRVLAHPGTGPGAPVNVQGAARSAVRLVENQIHLKARLVQELGPVPRVDGHESQLCQVLVNLLVNALQALPERPPEENEIRLRTGTTAEGRALLQVSDTGVGIDAATQGRIFDPFFTTKPVGQGTGLGLSIVHGIVRGLGGDISVSSRVGAGTTFTITLPASIAQEALEQAAAEKSRARRRLRLLLVDDEPNFRKSLGLLLKPDHDVVTAGNGAEALELLKKAESFDAVLCDLMMPGVTGMELHAELRKVRPELAARMIFMTGGAFTDEARDFLSSSEVPRLEKPFLTDALLETLDQVVASAPSAQAG